LRTRIVLADVALRLGRTTEAREYIDGATRTSRRHPDTGILGRELATIAERLADTVAHAPPELSERELAVLELMPSELSIQGIADALYVSRETVKTHRRHIYRKLSVASRADAVVAARRSGLIPERQDAAARIETLA
jgi:DNA-binding NarL/FixJ family response regulator